jgi:GT2 family glycosyltransferase
VIDDVLMEHPVRSPVSVVILTYNRSEELLRTVLHTLALPEKPPIIVVDNGSSDNSAHRVRKCFPGVPVISLPANIGAAARNIGARAACTEYVAFSDDDTVWAPGSLARASSLLRDHPGVGVLSARILVGAQGREDPASSAMAGSPLPCAGYPGRVVAGFMAGACVFRRSAFLQAGGYEPKLFIGGEEALLALDLATCGWSMIYSDALTVHHYPSPNRDAVARRRLLTRNALWVAWLRRHPVTALRHTLRALRTSAQNRDVLIGCIDALRSLHWAMRHRRRVPAHVEASWCLIERWLQDNAAGNAGMPATIKR